MSRRACVVTNIMGATEALQPDRNKTELTHRVTAAVMRWLSKKGFKPVETEVPVDAGWVADVAGVIEPTETELIKLKLVPPKPRYKSPDGDYREEGWKRLNRACYQAWDESKYQPWKAICERVPTPLTALVEVKTSLNDFRKDDKWTRPAPASLRYLAIPAGMVRPSELPSGWWILEYRQDQVRMTRKGEAASISVEQCMRTILAIAIRRDHHTRHARLRAAQKVERAEFGERETLVRLNKAISLILAIRRGGLDADDTLERVLSLHRIKRLPAHTLDRLRTMWGVDSNGDMQQLER